MYDLSNLFYFKKKKGLNKGNLDVFIEAKNKNKNKEYVPLRLEKFEECGWSVIAKELIPIDTYICEYAGNVLKLIFLSLFIYLYRYFLEIQTCFLKLQMKLH